MPNEEKKVKAPRDFTEEEKAMLLKQRAIREQKMKTDPEYKKLWEKRRADLLSKLPVEYD